MRACDGIDAQARTEKPIPQAELHPYQRAVVETALAYYYRGKTIQYDSVELTQQDRWQGGIIRETNYCSPETPNENRPMFSVCSAFCYEVYYYTFGGWELLGSQLNCWTVPMSKLPARDPLVVFRRNYKRSLKKSEPLGEREADLRELERIIEPGDVLVASNPAGGHAMLYVGDAFGDGGKWLIHCWGDKYEMKTGKDAWETNRDHNWEGGAILRDPLHTFLFDPEAISIVGRRKTITVLRPLKKLIRTAQ